MIKTEHRHAVTIVPVFKTQEDVAPHRMLSFYLLQIIETMTCDDEDRAPASDVDSSLTQAAIQFDTIQRLDSITCDAHVIPTAAFRQIRPQLRRQTGPHEAPRPVTRKDCLGRVLRSIYSSVAAPGASIVSVLQTASGNLSDEESPWRR